MKQQIIKGCISFVFVCGCYISAFAADVSSIKFNQEGAVKVPIELLKYNISLAPGKEFSENKLNSDIKRLYDTGYFTDVEAKTDKTSNGSVDITFYLKNTSRVKNIEIKGNVKYSESEILEQIPLKSTDPLTEKNLQQSVENIKKLYQQNGYYNATVYPETKLDSNGETTVIFNINENLRLKVNSVLFKGNTVFSNWTLADTVQTSHSFLNWLFDWGLYDEKVVKDDELRLRDLYWTEGYLDFKTTVTTEVLKDDPSYMNVIFNIYEGEQYKIDKIIISGNGVFSTEELDEIIVLKSGQVYDYKKELASIKLITDKYDSLGYCDFTCRTKLESDFQTHTTNVVFNMTEGKPYTIRNVNISGNKITKDYVIRRELPIEPGGPVDPVLIDAGKSRLMAMNYFKTVNEYTSATPIPDEKDVNYQVDEKGTAKVTIGGGFATQDGLLGRLTLSESNFDITDPYNYFRGGGQQVSLMAQYGTERSDFVASFVEPWLLGIPLRLSTSAFFHTREYPQWSERHMGFDVNLSKPIGTFNTISLGYILDFVKVSDMSSDYPQSFINEEEGNSRRGAITLGISRDTRDSIITPTSGYVLSADGTLNSEFLAGSSNYYQLSAKASGYWNFLDKLLILHLGAQGGTMNGFTGSDAVPIYERYLLGGQNNLRGFAFRTVSPLTTNDMPIGGQSMYVLTADIEHPIYKWIKGAPFVDVGNAWKNGWDFSYNVNVDVGYELRVLIPQISQAPLRLSIGFPIMKTEGSYSSSPQFYFDVGMDW